jgi:hypothetical protein
MFICSIPLLLICAAIIAIASSSPDPLYSLSKTNIVGFELVETHSNHYSGQPQKPVCDFPQSRNLPGWKIIDHHGARFQLASRISSIRKAFLTYSKPICEWISIEAHSKASRVGLREPAAKGATVRGIKPTHNSLSKTQW